MKFIFFFLLFIMGVAHAQELPPAVQRQWESRESETDDDSYLQTLEFLARHPLDLNTVTRDALQSLQVLSPQQLDYFFRYREALGKLASLYELQAVPGWDLETIRSLLPYVMIRHDVSLKQLLDERMQGVHYVQLRFSRVMEKSEGYRQHKYLGDPNHIVLRYRYQYRNLLSFGLTAEKDAGEQFFRGAQSKGFDFYSFHVFLSRWGRIKTLVLGDYTVNLGQGLVQWQGMGFGKSASVLDIKKQSATIMPYRSLGESNFNRGVAAVFERRHWQASLFFSYKKISGNLLDSMDAFSSLGSSGYHRTANEQADRNKIGHVSTGGNLSYHTASFDIGLNMIWNRFSHSLHKSSDPYQAFSPDGRSFWNGSIDYGYTFRNLHWFGELATDRTFHPAFLTGLVMAVDPRVDLSMVWRNLNKKYASIFGNAFTEGTQPSNEKGMYVGLVIRPLASITLRAYADFFYFPWIRYRMSAPSSGSDYFFQLSCQLNKLTELYLRYRSKNKPVNGDGGVIEFPEAESRQTMRFNFTTQCGRNIAVRSGVEVCWCRNEREVEEGFAGFFSLSCRPRGIFSGDAGMTIFQTGGYNSRLYIAEHDISNSISVPAVFGNGCRYFLSLQCKPSKSFSLSFQWQQLLYKDVDEIGSGWDTIAGNKKTEGKLQLTVNL